MPSGRGVLDLASIVKSIDSSDWQSKDTAVFLRPLVLGLFSETNTTNTNLAPGNPVYEEELRSS